MLMAPDELQRRVDAIKWHHSIDLGGGVVTPGKVDNPVKVRRVGIPESLDGRSVLDIGAWDGFYSFEAERRGAARVLATDCFCWNGPGPGTKAGFDLAREALASDVEELEIDPMEIDAERVGQFDVVLFLGVLYHLRYPLEALERVFSVTRKGGMAIIETHLDMLHLRRPAMAFYPGRELNQDPTNWIGPNPAAVIGMLDAVGYRGCEIYPPNEGSDEYFETLKQNARRNPEEFSRPRMTFHAFK
jgi:tRNA (mo5U34)-methyltransferase